MKSLEGLTTAQSEQRRHQIGNLLLDGLAKGAAELHPSWTRDQTRDAAELMEHFMNFGVLVARSFARWLLASSGPVQGQTSQAGPAAATRRRERGRASHDVHVSAHAWCWQSSRDCWMCMNCHRSVRHQSRCRARCSGSVARIRSLIVESHGHVVHRATMSGSAVGNLLFCVRCGAWSVERHRMLSTACPGCTTTRRQYDLNRIQMSRHPKDGNSFLSDFSPLLGDGTRGQ